MASYAGNENLMVKVLDFVQFGGQCRTRTCGLLRVKQAL